MSGAGAHVTVVRPEIQGLRAIAVGTVLIFHVWPNLLPGGYVGVDVFFVISGFLITSLLVREAENTGRIGFVDFYLRRARRLLPAAALVLTFVALAAVAFIPASMWRETFFGILASTFYVENWRLAMEAVDYLGAENAAGPVQHYWSLSVEEQFYLIWPALIAFFAWLARGVGLRKILRWVFLAVIGISLWMSISITEARPEIAYFVTHTRIWELALGGLVAVLGWSLPRSVRELAAVLGLACIVLAALAFSKETAFPGYAALLPTCGAALILMSGQSSWLWNPATLLNTKPLQFLGDISYSVYLWHWPLVVFLGNEAGAEGMGPVAGMLLILATIALSTWSKQSVEDRFRFVVASERRVPSIAKAAAFSFVPLVAGGILFGMVLKEEATLQSERQQYPGAMALSGWSVPEVEGFVPALSVLKRDRADVYDNGCHLGFDATEPKGCSYGDPEGKFRVLLVGDSHAVNWLPALQALAEERGWFLTSYTKSSCALSPVVLSRAGKPYTACYEWGVRVREIIATQKPDLVIHAHMHTVNPYAEEGQRRPSIRGAIVDLWREIESNGVSVVAIADTPRWKNDPVKCLANDRDCSVPLDSIRVKDPFLDAKRRETRVGIVDMTDVVCPERKCPAVIGNVVVWRDFHHLTASYSASASGILAERLDRVIVDSAAFAKNVSRRKE